MKLTPEELKKMDDQIREIGRHLGMEFDPAYIYERDRNYVSHLKSGNKKISFTTGDYKLQGRFEIRGEFPRDKRGTINRPYNTEWPQITVAIDRGPEKIAKAIQSRLLPEYEKQLAVALENNIKSDAYHDGRLKVLRAISDYFGRPVLEDDNTAIYPETGMGIYKIEVVSEGVKFEVSCGITEALKIFDILKEGKKDAQATDQG